MQLPIRNQKAFTLIELMVAMVVAGIVVAAMVAFQQSQVKTYVTQDSTVQMHQNARAAMHFMVSEIRMAGCDPTGHADPGITGATPNSITFTMDISGGGTTQIDFDGDGSADYEISAADEATGDSGEEITYNLAGLNVVRTDVNAGNTEVVARNFDALRFDYYDEDGNWIPPADLNSRLEDIQSVLISLLARSGQDVPGAMYSYTDTRTYTNQEGQTLLANPGDNFRRVMLETLVRLRNAG